MKIIGVILLIIIIVIAALLIYMGNKPAAPTGYQRSVETGGEMEAAFMDYPIIVIRNGSGILPDKASFVGQPSNISTPPTSSYNDGSINILS